MTKSKKKKAEKKKHWTELAGANPLFSVLKHNKVI